jgi:hypothetical protein
MHWTKTKMPLIIKKFGRKKKPLDEESTQLIPEVHKEQNLGARTNGTDHRIHVWKVYPATLFIRNCFSHGLANVNRNKSKRRKPWIRFERKHSLSMVHLDWHTSIHDGKK